MDLSHLKISQLSLRGISVAVSEPDLMWRIILVCVAILATIISVISFLSYLWASHSAPAVTTIKIDRSVVTREELQATLELYKAKQSRYEVLLTRRPDTPNLGGVPAVEIDLATTPSDQVVPEPLPPISPQ